MKNKGDTAGVCVSIGKGYGSDVSARKGREEAAWESETEGRKRYVF